MRASEIIVRAVDSSCLVCCGNPVHSRHLGHPHADLVWEAIQNGTALPPGFTHFVQSHRIVLMEREIGEVCTHELGT